MDETAAWVHCKWWRSLVNYRIQEGLNIHGIIITLPSRRAVDRFALQLVSDPIAKAYVTLGVRR